MSSRVTPARPLSPRRGASTAQLGVPATKVLSTPITTAGGEWHVVAARSGHEESTARSSSACSS
ncbi:hypothetical protein, partial [Microterricola pindariensis]|uniref:hypothetical protein n=1 Tax=Microterricola pindariensis TaxID=478010 RepID=UPI001E40A9A6